MNPKTWLMETADTRFVVEIVEKPSGSFKASYHGTKPKFAQILQPGEPVPLMEDVPGGELRGADLTELLGRVRDEIVRRYGAIVLEIEQ